MTNNIKDGERICTQDPIRPIPERNNTQWENWEMPYWQSSLVAPNNHWHPKNFRTADILGAGAFGSVRSIKSLITGEVAAVKSIPKKTERANDDLRKIRAEFSCWRALRGHPNIIELFAFYESPNEWCFVMECATFGSLSQVVRDKSFVFPKGSRAKIAAQLAHAIDTLHSIGFIHRDISCSNVMLTESLDCKLIDFGLNYKGRSFGTRCGTIAYMAPEVLRKEGSSVSSDWWSYGIVLFTMYMGLTPLQSHINAMGLRAKDLKDEEKYRLAKEAPINIPNSTPSRLRVLLGELLKSPAIFRLGNPAYLPFAAMKTFLYFRDIDWTPMDSAKVKIVKRHSFREGRQRIV